MSFSSSTKLQWVLLFLFVCGALWFFLDSPSDEDRIKAAIHEVADGAEAADIGRVMAPFSDDYRDEEGLGRSGIHGVLWQQFQRRGPISVWLSPITVSVNGDSASAKFEVGLVEGNSQTRIAWPIGAEALHFDVEFQREGGSWKIVSHTRDSVTGSFSGGEVPTYAFTLMLAAAV